MNVFTKNVHNRLSPIEWSLNAKKCAADQADDIEILPRVIKNGSKKIS